MSFGSPIVHDREGTHTRFDDIEPLEVAAAVALPPI
jgi:hypothetical protein